eukprot:2481189-Prymnesium_polylepis.1
MRANVPCSVAIADSHATFTVVLFMRVAKSMRWVGFSGTRAVRAPARFRAQSVRVRRDLSRV